MALLWIANLKCIAVDMLPKSAEQVAARMRDSLSEAKKVNNVVDECLAAPSGNEKCENRFPRVQVALLRSKRGRKCCRRNSELAKVHSSVLIFIISHSQVLKVRKIKFQILVTCKIWNFLFF